MRGNEGGVRRERALSHVSHVSRNNNLNKNARTRFGSVLAVSPSDCYVNLRDCRSRAMVLTTNNRDRNISLVRSMCARLSVLLLWVRVQMLTAPTYIPPANETEVMCPVWWSSLRMTTRSRGQRGNHGLLFLRATSAQCWLHRITCKVNCQI